MNFNLIFITMAGLLTSTATVLSFSTRDFVREDDMLISNAKFTAMLLRTFIEGYQKHTESSQQSQDLVIPDDIYQSDDNLPKLLLLPEDGLPELNKRNGSSSINKALIQWCKNHMYGAIREECIRRAMNTQG